MIKSLAIFVATIFFSFAQNYDPNTGEPIQQKKFDPNTGELFFQAGDEITSEVLEMLAEKKVKDILKELSINDLKIRDFYRLKIGE